MGKHTGTWEQVQGSWEDILYRNMGTGTGIMGRYTVQEHGNSCRDNRCRYKNNRIRYAIRKSQKSKVKMFTKRDAGIWEQVQGSRKEMQEYGNR